jgi:hypothetical protein
MRRAQIKKSMSHRFLDYVKLAGLRSKGFLQSRSLLNFMVPDELALVL